MCLYAHECIELKMPIKKNKENKQRIIINRIGYVPHVRGFVFASFFFLSFVSKILRAQINTLKADTLWYIFVELY